MKNLKRIISRVMIFCLALGIIGFVEPVKAHAWWDSGAGKVYVSQLDSDYKDGKYRFNYTFKYDKIVEFKDWTSYDITVSKIRLENSSGKSVTTWKDLDILDHGGSKTFHFGVDFSKLPSGTYYFKFTVTANGCSMSKSYSTSVSHDAATIKYVSAKYETSTSGSRVLAVYFKITGLKGYAPTIQFYNDKKKVVRTYNKNNALKGNDINYKVTWNLQDDSGFTISPGSYTIKITCNGRSCCRSLNLQ